MPGSLSDSPTTVRTAPVAVEITPRSAVLRTPPAPTPGCSCPSSCGCGCKAGSACNCGGSCG